MPVLHRDDVSVLFESHEPPCLSLFLPTHPAGNGGQQDPLRLRNMLHDGEGRLRALGLRGPQAKAVMLPARELLEDGRFWRQGGDGLAVFLSPGWHLVLRAPFGVPERLAVGDRFLVRPLLQGLWPDERFYVLALSLSGARLFVGSRFELSAVEAHDMPHGMQDVERYLVHEKQLQGHSGPRIGGASERLLHGHGPGDDPVEERVLEYFRQVDRAVAPHLRDRSPLVLAAVDYLLPLYRRAGAGELIMDEAVVGSPDAVPPHELHARAWAIVERRVQAGRAAELERYRELAAKGRASADLREIVAALRQARIEVLFVAEDQVVWGRADGDGEWLVHAESEPGDVDLLDRAAVDVLRTGGTVYSLPREQLPAPQPQAAIMRF
jgi:hypothetical protein